MRSSLCCVLVMLACANPQTASHQPSATTTTTQTPQPSSHNPHVIFPDGFVVSLEIAATDDTREQGLMYRDHLPEATGMLFLFEKPGEFPFWMKNTLIPLDMIWIDANHLIVHIAHDVPPCKADPCPSYPPNAVASYVLEVAGGVAAKHHLADGQTIRIEDLGNVEAR